MVNLAPPLQAGHGFSLHRENSFGQIKGLQRAQQVLDARKYELQSKLGLIKQSEQPDDNI